MYIPGGCREAFIIFSAPTTSCRRPGDVAICGSVGGTRGGACITGASYMARCTIISLGRARRPGAGFWPNDMRETRRVSGMGCPAECPDALNDLCWVFVVVEVYGQETVVCWKAQGRHLAGLQELRNVLALSKGHCRGFVADAWWRKDEVCEPCAYLSVCCAESDNAQTYLQRTTPSLRLSSTSGFGNCSPSVLSIHERSSCAACGV